MQMQFTAEATTGERALASEPKHRCEGCGAPARRLAKVGARNAEELRRLPKLGECCEPKLRPAGIPGFAFLERLGA